MILATENAPKLYAAFFYLLRYAYLKTKEIDIVTGVQRKYSGFFMESCKREPG